MKIKKPSFIKTSTLYWSKISFSFMKPFLLLARLRRWCMTALLESENLLSILRMDSFGRKLKDVQYIYYETIPGKWYLYMLFISK